MLQLNTAKNNNKDLKKHYINSYKTTPKKTKTPKNTTLTTISKSNSYKGVKQEVLNWTSKGR